MSALPQTARHAALEDVPQLYALHSRRVEPFFEAVQQILRRGLGCDEKPFEVSAEATTYVLDGVRVDVKSGDDVWSFWMGMNGTRVFFIVYVADESPESARKIFSFTFGGAESIGWGMNYESIGAARGNGTSVWGTCVVDGALAQPSVGPDLTSFRLTEKGLFWATDIALMVQSWIRTSQRYRVQPHPTPPAPL